LQTVMPAWVRQAGLDPVSKNFDKIRGLTGSDNVTGIQTLVNIL